MTVTAIIPNRPVFRAQEVCDLAELQPYVLRSWEAEFPDLGVAKTANGPRVYRRADVERVLRLKHLILVDGLTLAGARRQLSEEGLAAVESDETVSDADVAAMVDQQMRQNAAWTCAAGCSGFSACSTATASRPKISCSWPSGPVPADRPEPAGEVTRAQGEPGPAAKPAKRAAKGKRR